ncbi:MAG: hypothetical protein AB1553_05585 [Nitrospirota bacterium]
MKELFHHRSFSEDKKKLLHCVDVEFACAEIYKAFMNMFPEDRDFWGELVVDEEFHAAFYLSAEILKLIEEDPDQIKLPPAAFIEKTLEFTDHVKTIIRTRMVTLKEALHLALLLEQSVTEGFIFEVPETVNPVVLNLKSIIAGEESHMEKIKSYMITKGFSKLD